MVGIPKTQLKRKPSDEIQFATHTSTSWDRSVAEGFLGNEGGMLIEVHVKGDADDDFFCADVTWM